MIKQTILPSIQEMYQAFISRNSGYEGIFYTGVKTTGIFCRPTCSARKPKKENIEFFATAQEALSTGYRPCMRCRPMEVNGKTPEWVKSLLSDVEINPAKRWLDQDLKARGLDPVNVRRWFKKTHNITFHGYCRARKLGLALGQIRHGENLVNIALNHGYESLSGFYQAFENYFGHSPGQSKHIASLMVNRIFTPLGPMVVAANDEGIALLEFADRRMLETQFKRLKQRLGYNMIPGEHSLIAQLDEELQAYFVGKLKKFSVPIIFPGTDFQVTVWKALQKIPYGEVYTYDQLAKAINKPKTQRAVGTACGDNRLAIIIPCHRVVGSNGNLCGYGGQLWRKQKLLALEKNVYIN